MKDFDLLSVAGELWCFHAIGTGIIFTYHSRAKQVLILCSSSGTIIEAINNKNYNSPQDFKSEAKEVYIEMVNNGDTSLELSFYENATYVGNTFIEVDFDLIKN